MQALGFCFFWAKPKERGRRRLGETAKNSKEVLRRPYHSPYNFRHCEIDFPSIEAISFVILSYQMRLLRNSQGRLSLTSLIFIFMQ